MRVRIESAPAYEFVLSLAVAASAATTSEAEQARAAAGTSLIQQVRRFASSDWMWAHLLSLAYEAPSPRDVPSFLAYVEAVRPLEVQRRLAGYYVRWFRRSVPLDVMEAAIHGRPAAIDEFVERGSGEDPAWSESLRGRLTEGATRTKTELRAILEGWAERVFDPVIQPTMRRLTSATKVRRRSALGHSASEAVSLLLGWDYVPEPGISRVLLVPSLVVRPVIHEFEHEQTKFVCFPIQPGSHEPRGSSELLPIARALADHSRLRILTALTTSDLTAQDLADQLDLGLTTVLHHLRQLRAAGLVERGGRRLPYRIASKGLARATALLRGLGRPGADDGS